MNESPREPTIEERLEATEKIAEIALAMALQASPHGKANFENMLGVLEREMVTGITPSRLIVKDFLDGIATRLFPDWQLPSEYQKPDN